MAPSLRNACAKELAAILCRSMPATRQLLLLLNGLKIIDDRAHVLSCEDEFRHIRMTGGNAFCQSLGKAFDLVFAREGPERRGLRVQADAGAADGVTACAMGRQQEFATSRGGAAPLCQDGRGDATAII